MGRIEEYIQIIGADKAEAELRRLAQGEQQLGDETEDAGKKGGEAGQSFAGMAGSLQAVAATVGGVAALRQIVSTLKDDLIEGAQAAKEFADRFTDLQFLSERFDASTRDFVLAASKVAGRQAGEASDAFALLKSQLPELGEAQQREVFLQVAELARTTKAPMESLVKGVSSLSNVTGIQDPQVLQNLVFKLKQLAPEIDVGAIGESIADPLATGKAAGLDLPQTLAITEVMAKKLADQRKGAVAARNFILALAGKGTPEGQKIIRGAGVEEGDEFADIIGKLSEARAAGHIGTPELEALFGREAIAGGAALLEDPSKVEDFRKQFAEAQTRLRDLTADAINEQLADEITRLNFAIATTEAQIEATKISGPAAAGDLAKNLARLRAELADRARDVDAVTRGLNQGTLFTLQALGAEGGFEKQSEDVSGMSIRDYVQAVRLGGARFGPGGLQVDVTRAREVDVLESEAKRLLRETPGLSEKDEGRLLKMVGALHRGGLSEQQVESILRALESIEKRLTGEATVNVTNIGTQYRDEESGRHSPVPVDVGT